MMIGESAIKEMQKALQVKEQRMYCLLVDIIQRRASRFGVLSPARSMISSDRWSRSHSWLAEHDDFPFRNEPEANILHSALNSSHSCSNVDPYFQRDPDAC